MVRRVPYHCDRKTYEDYFQAQAGHGIPVFAGGRFRGSGIGSFLSGIGRVIFPMLKAGGKSILKEGAKTGLQIARDVAHGESMKTAVATRAKEAGKRLLDRALSRVMTGSGAAAAPPGQPERKRIRRSTIRPRGQTRKKRKKNKDIFDA